MIQKFSIFNVDSSAVKYYFKSLRNVSTDEESFWNMIEVMTEIIITEFENDEDDSTKHFMCIRGLLMLVLNQQLSRDRGQPTAARIMTQFNKIISKGVPASKRQTVQLSEHPYMIQFLALLPQKMMIEIIMQLQTILTHNIIQGAIDPQLFEQNIKMLDTFHWLNSTFKDKRDQIGQKEFQNDAVNSTLELRRLMD